MPQADGLLCGGDLSCVDGVEGSLSYRWRSSADAFMSPGTIVSFARTAASQESRLLTPLLSIGVVPASPRWPAGLDAVKPAPVTRKAASRAEPAPDDMDAVSAAARRADMDHFPLLSNASLSFVWLGCLGGVRRVMAVRLGELWLWFVPAARPSGRCAPVESMRVRRELDAPRFTGDLWFSVALLNPFWCCSDRRSGDGVDCCSEPSGRIRGGAPEMKPAGNRLSESRLRPVATVQGALDAVESLAPGARAVGVAAGRCSRITLGVGLL